MMNTFVEPIEDGAFQPDADSLTADERAWWEASIERDMRNRANGRVPEYLTGDEFWSRVEEAVRRQYEGVPA